ncbi:hypothetical protein E4U44_004138 [Claviceps purpurea]|nr:hypothetical protein E4U44_004138 [Claviceps purpurea]
MPRNAFRCIDECTKWAYSPFKYCLAREHFLPGTNLTGCFTQVDLYSKHNTTCRLQSKTYNRGQVYSGQAYGVRVDSVQGYGVQVDSVQVPTGLLIVLGLPGVRTICAARKQLSTWTLSTCGDWSDCNRQLTLSHCYR